MLDDLKMIHNRDSQDAFGIAEKQASQLGYSFDIAGMDMAGVTNIVYAGMGGSALAASIAQIWPGFTVPFEVVRQYDIPAYVSGNTLFIAASNSGNTEEVLNALGQVEDRGARIAVMASGGKLAEIARQKQYPVATLPSIAQPRYGVLYNLKAIIDLLAGTGLMNIDQSGQLQAELDVAAKVLSASSADWRPEVPTSRNPAKQLAQELMGRSVVVYAGPKLYPIAYKWKINCNENAKHIAWAGQLPEFNHNEFLGWSKQPVDKPYAVVELRSNLEHPRVQKRFAITNRLLSGLRPAPQVVDAQGDTLLQQMVWTMAFGDFVTLYLALLNGLDPSPIGLIETFKQEMNHP